MNDKNEATIAALTEQLGVPCQYSNWLIGRMLLQDIWKAKKKPHVIRDATYDLRTLPFNQASGDITWRRPLEPYMIGHYVHHYDKNSQYLSACRSVNMGIGDPVHVVDGDDGTHIVPGLPGVYRASLVQDKIDDDFDGLRFPLIIEEGQEWVTNEVLVYALQRGYEITIHEAWVFTDYAKILDTWAEKIWKTRQYFKGVNDAAYREMNHIAHIGVGSFATNENKHAGIDLIHPNWWADVVGKARVNMLCNLLKYGAPVCIRTDGLYYVSRDPNWRTAVPGILDRMDQCGGYKYEGTCQLTEEMYARAREMNDAELASMFKKAAGEI